MLENPTKPWLRFVAEIRSEGYIGPLPKTKKTKSKVTPSVTFSSDDDSIGSFSADSTSPTEARCIIEGVNFVDLTRESDSSSDDDATLSLDPNFVA
jgi:hypothetical protein